MSTMPTAEERLGHSFAEAFVALDSVDAIGARITKTMQDREFVIARRYLLDSRDIEFEGQMTVEEVQHGETWTNLRLAPGIHSFGVAAFPSEPTESGQRRRYRTERKGQMTDMAWVIFDGWPGDRHPMITLRWWNVNGVGQERVVYCLERRHTQENLADALLGRRDKAKDPKVAAAYENSAMIARNWGK